MGPKGEDSDTLGGAALSLPKGDSTEQTRPCGQLHLQTGPTDATDTTLYTEHGTMIKNRNGIDIKFSGEQLSKFNNSTVKELINKAQTDSDVQNMLIKASDDMAKDTKLLNSLTEPNRREINAFRNRMGQANI